MTGMSRRSDIFDMSGPDLPGDINPVNVDEIMPLSGFDRVCIDVLGCAPASLLPRFRWFQWSSEFDDRYFIVTGHVVPPNGGHNSGMCMCLNPKNTAQSPMCGSWDMSQYCMSVVTQS